MKKLIAGALMLSASTMSFASDGPGCGVGTMIWEGQSGIVPHVLAATTNGSFGNQTFGMTSGTLGCVTDDTIQSLALYLDDNIDNVARDMSRGEGENLDTLAVLMGVEEQDRAHFNSTLKKNFPAIFPTSNTTSDQALSAIVETLEQDQSLSKYAS